MSSIWKTCTVPLVLKARTSSNLSLLHPLAELQALIRIWYSLFGSRSVTFLEYSCCSLDRMLETTGRQPRDVLRSILNLWDVPQLYPAVHVNFTLVFVTSFTLILVGAPGAPVMDSLLAMSFVSHRPISHKLGDCGPAHWSFLVFMDKACPISTGFFTVWRII